MNARQLFVLLAGVVAISGAAPLIRFAAPAPALTTAALRLVLSAPPMIAVAALQRRRPSRAAVEALAASDLVLLVVAAVALAAHFAFWVGSVQRTSILASVVLVTMQPLFVAIGAWIALGERPTRAVNIGIALGVAGALLLVASSFVEVGADRGTLVGDLFALIGGVMSSVYLVVGRGVRQRLSTATYGAIVYSATAVILVGLALATRTPLGGQPAAAYVAIALLALVPQLIGHNAMNWALGSLSAAVVAVAILGEPVGAAIIGAALLHEVPTALEVAGGAIVLAGVYVALRGTRTDDAPLRVPIEV